ncbi:MAG TPA: bifunctional ornithine acetyltransferase/N-acetylglutamate synthase, partial [Gemmatimonadales bacterium]|nr:bifunctional ornithine acetyltransferase/N-acetylglutamate synthase [Gemmatimonadales bacterium]
AGVPLPVDRLSLAVAPGDDGAADQWLTLAIGGATAGPDLVRARQIFSARRVRLRLDLGVGRAEATVWTCDLSPDYVRINADYTS